VETAGSKKLLLDSRRGVPELWTFFGDAALGAYLCEEIASFTESVDEGITCKVLIYAQMYMELTPGLY
jgi:hypothetical protein